MATDITVNDVMHKGVLTAKKNDSIFKIAKVMARANIGGLVVTEKHKIVGVITEKDIIRKVLSQGKDYKKVCVEDIMSHPVRTITPETDLEDAARIMRDMDIERLPVLSGEKMVGILTARDIIVTEPALIEMMKEKGLVEAVKASEKDVSIGGECDECGNYAENLRFKNGEYLCEECRE